MKPLVFNLNPDPFGGIAGYVPAKRAASIKPIVALEMNSLKLFSTAILGKRFLDPSKKTRYAPLLTVIGC